MAQMLLRYRVLLPQHKIRAKKYTSENAHSKGEIRRGLIEKIKERFKKLEISVSPYDTAWVAMVPSNRGLPIQQQQPCFPGCLEWVMENQKADGSWRLNPSHPSLVKDSLSSTLACVLALQKWKVGEQLVQKGLDFIGSNRLVVDDKTQTMGFDIVFPGMISYAKDLGLNLPLDSAFLDRMHYHRDLQIQRGKGNSSLAYFAEGLGESYDWEEMIKKEQRSNGSLFNSPSTTAAALIHLRNDKCFHYLQSLLKTHGNAVPTIYPCDTYARLCMIDTLTRLGIYEDFRTEIDTILDETHRCWKQGNDEIFKDIACRALAFRLLRMYKSKAASSPSGSHIGCG